ncbi:HNH endonuclease [Clostridioides sp. ES-S-0001-02]|uniref:HNH endonuclease n=1 Tax=Clostridioides sp. ES-S-0001-02 TaxID=2770770 RepID=UPI001D11694A|nr:hypothetical protein [Clostridioides sp. ES-S-0001-02]
MNFYKSKEWKKLIETLKLERVADDGILYCEHCHKHIVKAYDCIAHHKLELNSNNINDFNISLNPNNIILVHHKCHNEIHNRFGSSTFKKVYMVYGSPCSGKTSYVKEVAGKNDLILDIDNIWQCISANDRYIKPNTLKTNVFNIRDLILDMIKCRTGKWNNAYVVGGYPLKMERERLEKMIGCEFIFINTSKEECLLRAANRPEEYKKYITDWFERYQE